MLFINRKKPILQVVFALAATILAIVAMCLDEMSDGDVKFAEPIKDDDFLEEVDYDCGWKSFRVICVLYRYSIIHSDILYIIYILYIYIIGKLYIL